MKYEAIIKGTERISIQDLSDITGNTRKNVVTDLQNMIDSEIISDYYIDHKSDAVISKKFIPETSTRIAFASLIKFTQKTTKTTTGIFFKKTITEHHSFSERLPYLISAIALVVIAIYLFKTAAKMFVIQNRYTSLQHFKPTPQPNIHINITNTSKSICNIFTRRQIMKLKLTNNETVNFFLKAYIAEVLGFLSIASLGA
ncbi:hypothetical protein H7R52_18755 [Weissella confusa]|uniref:Uncharacterized protein n=1 Tax=Weissella confusa TaxID=1583 RepID=A0A923NGU6_WEICO|nr:hypothetical protein [Weissella confusa]